MHTAQPCLLSVDVDVGLIEGTYLDVKELLMALQLLQPRVQVRVRITALLHHTHIHQQVSTPHRHTEPRIHSHPHSWGHCTAHLDIKKQTE